MLERFEDEVEAVFERGCEVVADLGDVAGDDFGEVGKRGSEFAELSLVRELGVLPVLLPRDRRAPLGVSNGTCFSCRAKP